MLPTYLPTSYLHYLPTYLPTYLATYLSTYQPTYLHYLQRLRLHYLLPTNLPTYLPTSPKICLPTHTPPPAIHSQGVGARLPPHYLPTCLHTALTYLPSYYGYLPKRPMTS